MKRFSLFIALLLAVFYLFPEDETSSDDNACDYARKTQSIDVWQKYLEKFPEGKCAFEAESEIEKLKNNDSTEEQPSETPAEGQKEPEKEPTYIFFTSEPVLYYRPYKTAGIALLVVGLAADVAGGITYYTGITTRLVWHKNTFSLAQNAAQVNGGKNHNQKTKKKSIRDC